jgi:acetyl esterase/lipase
MFEALRRAGGATDLRLFHGMQHEFVRLPGMVDPTMHDVATFLDRHGVHAEAFASALEDADRAWAERVAARASGGGPAR